ncbi:MAG: hypothetical protein R2716_02120 [Microthrixaceae bacterium]
MSGTTTLVSEALAGGTGAGPSRSPSISGDGRFVAFDSGAPNLVAGDDNESYDVFVRDLSNGTTELVSLDADDLQPGGSSYISWDAAISDDGSRVVFNTYEALVADDTNGERDVYVRDRWRNHDPGVGGSRRRSDPRLLAGGTISGDGGLVAFETGADGVVPGDSNGFIDILATDLDTLSVELVSADAAGQTLGSDATSASLSDDGRYVAFTSYAALVAGDTDTSLDVFRRTSPRTAPGSSRSIPRVRAPGSTSSRPCPTTARRSPSRHWMRDPT